MWATGLLLGLAAGPLISGAILDHASYGRTFLSTVGRSQFSMTTLTWPL
jgi:hypothetical protein